MIAAAEAARAGAAGGAAPGPEGIAIIGMSCRFPAAANPVELWRNLEQGAISRDLPELGEWFDAALFGISPREAQILDPQHRLLLECAWEALEASGHAAEDGSGVVGVFAGSAAGDRRPLATAPASRGLEHFQRMVAIDPDYLPLRVSYKLGLTGPSFAVQAAAASSLVAVHLACESLLAGEVDLALAGAVRIDAVSRQRGRAANGAGVVVLRRLADALADGDGIRAVVLGSAIGHGGRQRPSRGGDAGAGTTAAIAASLAAAGFGAGRLGLLELHTGGGGSGDGWRQLAALAGLPGWRGGGACAVGSVAANLGDLEEAAGMAGLIKAVLALEHRKRPASPSPGRSLRFLPSRAELAGTPFCRDGETTPWLEAAAPRCAAVSAVAAGIANAGVVLTEAPPAVRGGGVQRACHLLPLSAASAAALGRVAAGLARHLRECPEDALADAAYTLQVGRRGLRHRQALVCASREQAIAALAACAAAGGAMPRPQVAPELCFVLPAEGAPHLASLRGLWRDEPCWRRQLAGCAAACQAVFGRTPLELCEGGGGGGASEEIRRAALYVVEVALGRLLMDWGLRPAAMAAEGTGELAGACLAGVLPFEIGLDLAARGRPLAAAAVHTREEPVAAGSPGKIGTDAVLVELGLTAGESAGAAAPLSACDPPLAAGAAPRHHGGEGLMALTGRLWALGMEIQWPALYPDTADLQRPRRVSLPTYPFERRRYPPPGPPSPLMPEEAPGPASRTASPAAALPGAAASLQLATPVASVRLPFWRPAPLENPGGRPEAALAGTPWLLLGGDEPLSGALARLLRQSGCEVSSVQVGKAFARLGPRRYQAAPASAVDLLQVLRAAAGRAENPLRIVNLWPLGSLHAAAPEADALAMGLGGLLALAEALGGSWGGEASEVAVVAAGLYGVEAGEQPRPEMAALLGGCRLLEEKAVRRCCRIVDLLPPAGGEPARRSAGRLLAELAQAAPAAPVALRRARRWVRDEQILLWDGHGSSPTAPTTFPTAAARGAPRTLIHTSATGLETAAGSATAVLAAVAVELRRLAALQASLAERPGIPLSLYSPAAPAGCRSSRAVAWATEAAFAAFARRRVASGGGWTQAVAGLPVQAAAAAPAALEALLQSLATTVRWPEIVASPVEAP